MGKYIEVEVDLDDFATDDLIEEVESRGYTVTKDIIALEQTDIRNTAEQVYWQIRDSGLASNELRELISHITGKIL